MKWAKNNSPVGSQQWYEFLENTKKKHLLKETKSKSHNTLSLNETQTGGFPSLLSN